MSKKIYASDEGAGLLRSQPSGRMATAGLGPAGRLPVGNNLEIRSTNYGITSIYASSGRVVSLPASPTEDETSHDESPANT
jgi:hypothetical protein